jgi:hypothetical protein
MTELLYGDVEAIAVPWLAARFTDARACTELPATLPAKTIQVVRFGGSRPELPYDLANVDVDCYAGDRAAAHLLAERVAHALMYDLPGYRVGGTTVLSVECLNGPSWAPYDNTSVRRMTAAYQFRTHNLI